MCAARQYKEAGRVSSELKQLRTELEPQRQQVSHCTYFIILYMYVGKDNVETFDVSSPESLKES